MDDLMEKISQTLNDPKSMREISQLAAALSQSMGENSPAQSPPNEASSGAPPDISAMLSSLLSSPQAAAEPANTPPPTPSPEQNMPDISKLMQLMNVISSSGKGDKNIALLLSLKPLLREENQIKIDRLIKIFKLMSAYPLIRDSGLLGGDLFG